MILLDIKYIHDTILDTVYRTQYDTILDTVKIAVDSLWVGNELVVG